MFISLKSVIAISLLTLLWGHQVLAQGGPPGQFSIGAFSGVRNSEYLSEKNKTLILPAIQGRVGRWSFEGRSVSYALIPGPFPMSLSLKADYFSAGFDPKRSPELSHLSKRRSSAHLGLEARMFLPYRLSLRAYLAQDILGVSSGQDGTLALSRAFIFGPRLQFIPSLNVSYWSKSVMRTYYGITMEEGIDRLPFYQPSSSGLFPGASMVAVIGLGGQWRGSLFANTRMIPSEARRSPLTARSSRDFFGAALTWVLD